MLYYLKKNIFHSSPSVFCKSFDTNWVKALYKTLQNKYLRKRGGKLLAIWTKKEHFEKK